MRSCLLALVLAQLSVSAHAEDIVVVSGSNLLKFDSASPADVDVLAMTGYGGPYAAIDNYHGGRALSAVRIHYDAHGSLARVWSIDPDTGAAALNHLGYFGFEVNSENVGLAVIPEGSNSSYLRGLGANGRHWVFNQWGGGGVESSQSPAFVAGDVNEGQTPVIHALAYRDTAAAGDATLFGIDVPKAILVRVGSVNGSPDAPASGKTTTVGGLGVVPVVGSTANFDTSDETGMAFATLTTSSGTGFYQIDLDTGAATLVGLIGDGTIAPSAMAVLPPAPPDPPAEVTDGGSSGGGGGALGTWPLVFLMLASLAKRRSGQAG